MGRPIVACGLLAALGAAACGGSNGSMGSGTGGGGGSGVTGAGGGQSATGGGRIEQALATVDSSRALHDIALVDELLQHAPEALLGDLQRIEQVGDAKAAMAGDEVKDAMVRPAEAEILEDGVGIAGEVAVGEEQQLGISQQLGIRPALGLG